MKNISLLLLFTLVLLNSCGSDNSGITTDDTPITTGYTQYGTPYANLASVEDMVIYEVNLRAFSSSGTIQGVINRLDEIKSLGVNVIWLMPIHPIGQVNSVNSPYCVKNFKEVSSEYGTLSDLRNLTTQAHSKGMAVIIDWVANHTSWDNPWITSNSNWYTKDSSGNITIPAGTNWQDVADLNFNNNEMKLAMIDAMKYWLLEANIDGFRCDYADGVPFEFWNQAISNLKTIPNRNFIFLAEGNRNDHFSAGFDLTYAWDFYYRMKDVYGGQSANILFSTNTSEYSNVPNGKHRLRYTTNHDESAWEGTPMQFFNGKNGALAASIPTIFMNGVPLFYTGQEVGRLNTVPFFSNSPINWNENPDMFSKYQDIMEVYSSNAVARKGSNTNYSTLDIVCFKKTLNNEEMIIITNCRNASKNFVIPSELENTTWTNTLTNAQLTLSSSLSLNSYEYLILKRTL